MNINYDYLLKIVIIGNTSVGKSAILRRFCDDNYVDAHISTIGVDFRVKNISLYNQNVAKLQIWDTSGQERFKTITSSYYRGSHGIIVAYDITDTDSFKDVTGWINELNRFVSNNTVLFLVGTKLDLAYKRTVSYNEGRELANSYGISFVEVSSFDDVGIDELFLQLATIICSRYVYKPSNQGIKLNGIKDKPPPCCII